MDRLGVALLVATGLLVAGYIGINFAVRLPAFLVGENIAYAVAYSVLGYLLARGRRVEGVYVLVAGFNAGRVSRTIVEPTGRIGSLALQHVPLLALILLAGLLALIRAYRRR